MIKTTNFITANNILFGDSLGKIGTITAIQNEILSRFEEFPSYQKVTINTISQDVQIVTISNNQTKDNFKKILSKPNETFSVGDIVVWDGMTFLITDIDEDQQIQTKGTIQLCNNTFNFYHNNTLYQIPCIVESNIRFQDLRLEENKYLILPDDKITIRISYNDITKNIERGHIFKLTDDNYKVISVNKVTENGLIVLKLEYAIEEAESHVFTLEILNGDSIQISQSQSLTINAQLTDNGEIVDSPTLLYSSSDESIATIDQNGVVSILSVGTVTFTVSMISDNTITDSIVVEIVAEQQNNYTATISGESSIIKNYTKEYSCVFKNNGLPIIKESIFWLTGIDNQPTTLAIITSQNSINNTCVVCGGNLGYVKLWAKSIDEQIIVEDGILIQIKNIF